jgi:hypothetical protein
VACDSPSGLRNPARFEHDLVICLEHLRVVNTLWLEPAAVESFVRSWRAQKKGLLKNVVAVLNVEIE